MGTPKSRARWLRGGLVGMTSAVMTIGAHAAAGGGIPSGGALVISLLACATVGTMVGSLRLAGRSGRRLVTATALCAAQLLGHAILVAAGHQHAGNVQDLSASMAATHLAAAAILAVAITAVEHLYLVCASLLCWLRLFAAAEGASVTHVLRAVAGGFVAHSALRCPGLGMRAPPLSRLAA